MKWTPDFFHSNFEDVEQFHIAVDQQEMGTCGHNGMNSKQQIWQENIYQNFGPPARNVDVRFNKVLPSQCLKLRLMGPFSIFPASYCLILVRLFEL